MSRGGYGPHRDVFFAYYGPGPYACWFDCGVHWSVQDDRKLWHIHHIDEDIENNIPENLAPACLGCHLRWHRLGNPIRPTPRQLSPKSLNELRLLRAAITRKKWDAGEMRPQQRDPGGWQGGKRKVHKLYRCTTCAFEANPAGMGQHLKWKQHAGRELIGTVPVKRHSPEVFEPQA